MENTYPLETAGQVLSIRKLYRPAGDDGLMRFNGHEIHYQFELAGHCLDSREHIPKNPDPQINQQLRAIEAGQAEIIVKYQASTPQKSIIRLIHSTPETPYHVIKAPP